jgi:hypothetical protein
MREQQYVSIALIDLALILKARVFDKPYTAGNRTMTTADETAGQ